MAAIQNVVQEVVKFKTVKKMYFACQDTSSDLIPNTGIEITMRILIGTLKIKEYTQLTIQEVVANHPELTSL